MALEARLDLPPAEAVRFFEAKGNEISWDYTEVWRGRNVQAFTVAKATSLDVLGAIRKEVARAIGEGQTFDDFKRRLRPRLQELGWWGTQEVLDADTGELTRAQLGSVRRLRTIYQTNVQTAYMAGRFKRYRDNATDRPYWRYVAVMDGRTRPEHAALNGRVWRWDDPIWEVIWPPNGWGCRCRIQALTEGEFQALGVDLENGNDAIVELQVPVGKDGQQVTVQGVKYRDELGREKVFRPDPGWDYNPGEEWARFDRAAGRPDADVPAAEGLPRWSQLDRPPIFGLDRALVTPQQAPALLPVALGADDAARMVRDAVLRGEPRRVLRTPLEELTLVPELLQPGLAGTDAERWANFVAPTLENPFEVWLTPFADGTYRKRYLGLFDGLVNVLFVVRENRDGTLAWEALDALQADVDRAHRLRLGTLLFGQPWPPGGG